MKLYYSPGTCSLASHIVLREAELPFDLIRASTKTHKLDDGTDYYGINPKGYVPLLQLDDGQKLTEGPAIMQYLADKVPAKKLVPPAGTMERYRLVEWLNFISTELHKSYSPLFNPEMPEPAKQIFRVKLDGRYRWLDGELPGKQFLMGDTFTVADAYLFVVSRWAKAVGVDITGLPNVTAYLARVEARPAVQAALKAESPKK